MTKKELIEALEPYDDDCEIIIDNWTDNDAWYEITEVCGTIEEDIGMAIKISIDL